MLNPGDFTFSPSAALCFLSSVSSFLVQHSARGEDKVHNSDQSSVVSAPEEKGMEAEVVFLMRNKGEELYSLRQGMLEAAQAKLRMKRLRINNVLYYMAVLLCSCCIPSCQEFFPLAQVCFGLLF